MGVNKLLKAGVEGEKEQLEKAKISKPDTPVKLRTEADKPPESKKKTEKKHPGGRPTNISKGKTSRKQYTLTLVPDDYKQIMELAETDGLSFSKYVERAVNEYINNHKNE